MRIAILGGGGAMGGLFGGYLSRAGNDVTLIDVSKAAIGAINDNKLFIEEKDGSQPAFAVRASDDPESVGPVDLIVNFVKCYHTEAAIKSAAPMIGAETAVLSLQNGWGNAPRIASIVGEGRVLVGLTYHSATLLAPGKVKHPGVGMTYIGELGGKPSERLEAVAETFRGASFDVTVSENILNEVWKKLALNACTLPTAALLRFFAHELVAFEPAKQEMAAILREVVDVANAQGIALDYERALERDRRPPGKGDRRQGVDAAGRRGEAADRDRGDQRRDRGRRQPRRCRYAAQSGDGLDGAGRRTALPQGEGAVTRMGGRVLSPLEGRAIAYGLVGMCPHSVSPSARHLSPTSWGRGKAPSRAAGLPLPRRSGERWFAKQTGVGVENSICDNPFRCGVGVGKWAAAPRPVVG